MTGDGSKFDDLNQLADALVEDILAASDEEILREVAEDRCDLANLVSDSRALVIGVAIKISKKKLAAARGAVAAAKMEKNSGVCSNQQMKMRREILAKNAELSQLTLAARSGDKQSDRDIDSAIDDLAELGFFEDEDLSK